MEKITDEQLISLIEGESNPELEQTIANDPAIKKRFIELKEVLDSIESAADAEVPAHIGMNIQTAILNQQSKQNSGLSWMQIAASITILLVGFGLGKFSGGSNSAELADLRNEIQSLKKVTMTGALQTYSASERIMAVNQIEQSSQEINPELIKALINTLNSDDSPNVRYASLQALNKYIDNSIVRAELVKSLESQNDALIQISLISILVEAEERSAVPEVKQQAEIAIQVLT
jgi:hypothetical protein